MKISYKILKQINKVDHVPEAGKKVKLNSDAVEVKV